MADSRGRGWHGDPERHRKAAMKAQRGRIQSSIATVAKVMVLVFAVPMKALAALVPADVELPDRATSATVAVIRPVFRLFALFNGPARWLKGQFIGTLANLWATIGYFTRPESTLPPTAVSTLGWFNETIPRLLGLGNTRPRGQVAAAASTVVLALLATFVTGGALIATVVIILGFGSIGLARLVPAVDGEYDEWRSALGLDRSKSRSWRRD